MSDQSLMLQIDVALQLSFGAEKGCTLLSPYSRPSRSDAILFISSSFDAMFSPSTFSLPPLQPLSLSLAIPLLRGVVLLLLARHARLPTLFSSIVSFDEEFV